MNLHSSIVAGHLTGHSLESVQGLEARRIRCYAALALCDTIALTFSFLVVNYIYLGSWVGTHGVTMLSVILPIYLWTASVNGAYSGEVLRDPRIGAINALKALMIAGAIVLIIAYSFKAGAAFSRVVFWAGMLVSLIALLVSRLVAGRSLLSYLGGSPFRNIILVDGVDCRAGPHDIVLDVKHLGFDPRTDEPLEYHRLAKLIADADRVLVACQDDHAAAWGHVLKSMAVDGEIFASDVDRIGTIGISEHLGRRTLVVSAGPLHLRDRMVKRLFDIAASSAALLLLLPVLVATAIAIRLESPGPILFKQQRIGRDNKLFMMYKFRSMFTDRCDATASVLTGRSDSRVTRVGGFIRRNSLDELPQLLNVLRGDMSMVGPRPHALSARAADQLYWEIDARYRHRHAVKPGVTGLAQIRGFRGATVSTADLTNRLSSDLEYLREWSMRKDFWILFRTLFVIRHENAF